MDKVTEQHIRDNYPKGTGARVNLMCRVDPLTMELIRRLSEDCGLSRGEVIDNLVKWYIDDAKKEL